MLRAKVSDDSFINRKSDFIEVGALPEKDLNGRTDKILGGYQKR